MRVDAHQHFWHYDPVELSFVDDRMPILKRDYLPSDLKGELDAAGFDGCVAVQARQTLEETRFLLSLADEHRFIRAVVGWIDLRAPDLEEQLGNFCRHPSLRGVRHIVQAEPDGFLEDEAFRQGVSRLPQHSLCYDMLVYERQLPQACRFMHALPQVSFVLDHVAKPNLIQPDLAGFEEKLRGAAELPNVVCKLSGLVTEADWGTWTPAQLRPFIEVAAELFGVDRLLFGSDWPVCLLAARYEQVVSVVDECFKHFSHGERTQLFGDNAVRVYGITD